MAERGQHTTIRFGTVSAAVSLLKTSGKPKAAQHETKRVLTGATVEVSDEEWKDAAAEAIAPDPDERGRLRDAMDAADPLGEPAEPGLQRAALEGGFPVDPEEPHAEDPEERARRAALEQIPRETREAFAEAAGLPVVPGATPRDVLDRLEERGTAPEYTPPPTTVQQGIHRDDGTWVDLTDRFEEVDRLTKLEGMHVVATIATNTVPRERVRDAFYVTGTDPDTFKVLALLWRGLRMTHRAAVVRWTKKTAQACGIIVARGALPLPSGAAPRGEESAHLVLLEVEWAQNMRGIPRKAGGPIMREVEDDEVAAAVDLVQAFAAGPSALNDLADERLAKRAELLERAKAGTLEDYEPPAEPLDGPDATEVDLTDALAVAASRVRDRASA